MSHMSSQFTPTTNSAQRAELVPLSVHPADRERLRALSGIWPVEDTLSRMIDVFIASGAAKSASHVQSYGSETSEPERGIYFAKNVKTESPDQASAASRVTPEPAPTKARPKVVMSAPAEPPQKSPLLAFTRDDCPDLRFTSLTGFTLGETHQEGAGLKWVALFEEAVAQVIESGHGLEGLQRVGVRFREGKRTDKGFRWCERVKRSIQVSTSNYMFIRVLRIADLLGVQVRIGVSWDQAPGAAHPGARALISAKPQKASAARPTDTERPIPPRNESGRFPFIGSMVSYVYLDRPEDEKLSHLVEGVADPESGQVSIGSPLGRTLIETPTGSTATLGLKGLKRQIRVLDVTSS